MCHYVQYGQQGEPLRRLLRHSLLAVQGGHVQINVSRRSIDSAFRAQLHARGPSSTHEGVCRVVWLWPTLAKTKFGQEARPTGLCTCCAPKPNDPGRPDGSPHPSGPPLFWVWARLPSGPPGPAPQPDRSPPGPHMDRPHPDPTRRPPPRPPGRPDSHPLLPLSPDLENKITCFGQTWCWPNLVGVFRTSGGQKGLFVLGNLDFDIHPPSLSPSLFLPTRVHCTQFFITSF